MNQMFFNNCYELYKGLPRSFKHYILAFADCVLFLLSIFAAFSLRFNFILPVREMQPFFWQILILIALKILIFDRKGIYRPVLRYAGVEFSLTAFQAVVYSSGIPICLAYFLRDSFLPRSVLIIDALLTLVLVVGLRLIIHSFFRRLNANVGNTEQQQSIVIYGAGVAGSQLARTLLHEPNYRLVAFVDGNPELQHQVIQGIKVYSPSQLPELHKKSVFEWVILAMPSLDTARKRQIVESLGVLPVAVKTIPPLKQLLSGELSIREIRNIDVAELLGREEILPYPELIKQNVTGKSVLVTGAGGSIGSELCRQIAILKPKCLLLYELNEYALYKIDLELGEHFPQLKRFAYLGNVTNQTHLEGILRRHSVDTIYHAAAYKHVPLVEINPAQGVYTNVWGTLTAANSAIAASVSNFVLISTDKAVRPTNVMGASKRVAELGIQALSALPNTPTCFAIVRFGNVLDSSGSVVPRFRAQIAQGKPITLTHKDVTRYFMSIPEAARLVMQAGAMAKGGEVFLLDMGEPIRIYDLAVQMIRLSGLEPEQDINIKITGLRPGEKLYEELLIDKNKAQPTKHPKIFSANEYFAHWEELQPQLELLLIKASLNDSDGLREILQKLVPEYQPGNGQKSLVSQDVVV